MAPLSHEPVQSSPWAVRLVRSSPEVLGSLRCIPGIRVHVDERSIWLQGDDLNERIAIQLRTLPGAERFRVVDDGQLTFWDETVPRAKLPAGTWRPLAEWLTVELPAAAFAPKSVSPVELSLVRSASPAEANVLRTDWPCWRDYAVVAPQIRLNQWSFAVSENRDVLIRGNPTPPIPGQRFAEKLGIAIPVGWQPDPPVDLESLRRVLQLGEGELALFDIQGQVEMIPESVFVRATRSAVRLTDKALTTEDAGA